MTHEHDLPKTLADVQECATELYAIILGQQEASYVEIAAHAHRLLGFMLYVIGADEEANVIGVSAERESALQFKASELHAINDCMVACRHRGGPIVGGPLASWALRVIISQAAEVLLTLIAELLTSKDPKKAISGLGDGTLLRVLLENLPQIVAAILALSDTFSDDED